MIYTCQLKYVIILKSNFFSFKKIKGREKKKKEEEEEEEEVAFLAPPCP